ncbi:MAG TPA: hypothetical protein ENK91_05345 [Bacteroidetes bacterium]|nr:hypothetical protein [Bacteroidota bacterium]
MKKQLFYLSIIIVIILYLVSEVNYYDYLFSVNKYVLCRFEKPVALRLAKWVYSGRTFREFAKRAYEHGRKGKIIIEKTKTILAEIPESYPEAYKTMKGIEEITIQWSRDVFENVSNVRNAIRKINPKTGKVDEYYKEAINQAEAWLKQNNKNYYDEVKEILEKIKSEF